MRQTKRNLNRIVAEQEAALDAAAELADKWGATAARRGPDIGPGEGTALDTLAACARELRKALAVRFTHGGAG